MKLTPITSKNIIIGKGKKYKVTDQNRPSEWAVNFLMYFKEVEYIIPTKQHDNSEDVILFVAYNKMGSIVDIRDRNLLSIGYLGNFDLVEYEREEEFNLDNVLSNLDRLEDKITKKPWYKKLF